MYINRIVIKDLPGMPDRDLVFEDKWRGEALKSILLTGPNGSGKSTILRVVANLWEMFGTVLTQTATELRIPQSIQRAGLVAIQICDLIDQPFWLYSEQIESNETFDFGSEPGIRIPISRDLVKQSQTGVIQYSIFNYPLAELRAKVLPKYFGDLITQVEKLELGVATSGQIPANLLFIQADSRQIFDLSDGFSKRDKRPEALYRWLALYRPRTRDGNLELMLRNLKVRDPEWFQRTLVDINRFLQQNGKSLTDFDSSLRIQVQTIHGKGNHLIHDLSSGEQQCLILIFMVSRWLAKGGVVLIDEPDLHLHGSWQRSLIHELERLVADKQGQLIITSHSPLVVEEYRDAQRFHLEPEAEHS